jgi:hypothetical protein
MTDEEKDEIDLLSDSVEDLCAIQEAKDDLLELGRARRAIGSLIQKGWIALWWCYPDDIPESPKQLTGSKLESALKDLQEDRWWEDGDWIKNGFYAFAASDEGLAHYQSDPLIREYMRKEWMVRAIQRGIQD